MKNKPDAYEMNEDPSLNRVVKCGECDFKAVKAAFVDENKCPRCGCRKDRPVRKNPAKAGRW